MGWHVESRRDLNFAHNANVVGQENGSAVTLGASFDGMITQGTAMTGAIRCLFGDFHV